MEEVGKGLSQQLFQKLSCLTNEASQLSPFLNRPLGIRAVLEGVPVARAPLSFSAAMQCGTVSFHLRPTAGRASNSGGPGPTRRKIAHVGI